MCGKGYFGAQCKDKVPTLENACEDCKPNCYKHKNKCEKCGACYDLVQQKFNEFLNQTKNVTTLNDLQKRYESLKAKVAKVLSDIVDPPNEELDKEIDEYYKQLDLIKNELKELIGDKFSNELDEKLRLFDKNLDQINEMKDAFRKELANLAISTENADLAKLVNEIISAKDKAVKHAEDVEKIAEHTNITCRQTCKQYDDLDKSLNDTKEAMKNLQQKLLDWDELKNERKKILSEFNDLCNDLSDVKVRQYENDPFDTQINDLDEKLKAYQQADKLLDQMKDTNLDKVLTARKNLEETIQDFDGFVNAKEVDLTDLTSKLKELKKAELEMSEIDKRLEEMTKIISNYFENNKSLIDSIKILLSLSNTDDTLTLIEREIELLTREFQHILQTAEKLYKRVTKAKKTLDGRLQEFQTGIKEHEENWKEDEQKYLDVIAVYDFVLKEIANEESLNAVEEQINEGYALLEATHVKRMLDIELEYLGDVREELGLLTRNPSEICGSKTGDSETGAGEV